jgi:hypothetical protein
MPVAESPVDDRDQAKQREQRVAQVSAVHSTIARAARSRRADALDICPSPPRLWGICARKEGEAVGDPADVRAFRPYHTWYEINFWAREQHHRWTGRPNTGRADSKKRCVEVASEPSVRARNCPRLCW